jgi:hypothetical protein
MDSRKFQLTLFCITAFSILIGFVPAVRMEAMGLLSAIVIAYFGANVAQDFAERENTIELVGREFDPGESK